MKFHRILFPEGRVALSGAADAPCAESARPFVLAATIVASAMAFIDGTVVTIALPAIQNDLSAGFATLQWIVNAYALMLGGLILVGGSLGDRIGRRRVFVAGIAVFALSSLLCAIAASGPALVAFRALQGIGAALLVPQSLAILSASFPKTIRGRVIGTWAAASAITTALGPTLGGFLIDGFGWRAAFWINLPLSCLAIWLALRFVPESRDETAQGTVDWLGALLAVLSIGALSAGLTRMGQGAGQSGAGPGFDLGLMIAGAFGLAAFVAVERRVANPIMALSLFASRAFSGANLLTVFIYGALAGALFLLPFELIARRGLSATQVGLTLLPIGIVIGLLSRFFGAQADQHGARRFLIAGSAMVTVACCGFALGFQSYWFGILAPVIALSLGMAAVVSPLTATVMNAVPDRSSGAASGVNNAASRLAGLVAVALLGAAASGIFARHDPAAGLRFGMLPPAGDPSRVAIEGAFQAAYSGAMWIAAGMAGLGIVTAAVMLKGGLGPRTASTNQPRLDR